MGLTDRLSPTRFRVASAIHLAALAAAGIGGGLAQLPLADAMPLAAVQIGMLHSIARAHGHRLTDATAEVLLATFTAMVVGRTASQLLIGWVPGFGNVTNAATAASITEAIGWSADGYFTRLTSKPEVAAPAP
jgi:uncharacterized protein (DUF697 family)